MIGKQQKYIEDNEIGMNSVNGDKSKVFFFILIDMDLFLDGGELDFED